MRHEIFDLLLLICCVYAIWRGGAPERIAGATLLIGDILSVASVLLHPGRFRHEEFGLFAIDLVILVILVVIALRSRRWWPLILAGLQLDGVLAHFVHLIAPRTLPIAYLNATALWAYPMVIILAIATRRHRTRLTHLGEDPAWRPEPTRRPSVIATTD
ncbi:hypothetical protein [Sphingomonas oryzagri]